MSSTERLPDVDVEFYRRSHYTPDRLLVVRIQLGDSILRTATVSMLPPLSRLATLTHQANDTKALQSGVTSDELSWAVRDMWARIDGSAQLPVLDPPSIPSPTTL